jgi:glycine cleavage system H protein
MSRRIDFERAQVCIWMSAGLLTYKLCDHDFDCDSCPLDAAMRGSLPEDPRRESLLTPCRDARAFPEDRFYTAGHLWVRSVAGRDNRLLRCGIDAFAAALIGRCDQVGWEVSEQTLVQGATMCQIDIDLGLLTLGAPIRSVVVEGNLALQNAPDLLVTEPYEDGWIVELRAEDPSELDHLLAATTARANAQKDLQWFRRRVATQLLSGVDAVGPSLADGGEIVSDLRQMLGGPAYLELLCDLIH